MSYLLINGIDPLTAELEEDEDGVVADGRGVTGRAFHDRQERKRKFMLGLIPQRFEFGDAWRRLLEGRGHRFSFDVDLYSAKGLGAGVADNATVGLTQGGVTAKFGDGFVDTGASELIYNFTGYDAWTVSVWFWTGSAWQLRQQTSDLVKLQDGIAGAYAWDYGLVEATGPFGGGFKSLTLPSGSQFDDLVVLPFVMPPSLLTQWPTTRAFSSLPHLELSGDATNGEIYEVVIEGGVQTDHETDAVPPHLVITCDLREV